MNMNLRISESPFGGRVLKVREFSGLRLVDGVYRANTKVPNHAHEQAVLCIALKGECSEIYAAKVRRYQALSVEFLPSNQAHALDFPSADTRAFSIDLAPYWLERAREYSLRLDDSVHCGAGPLSELMIKVYREFLETDYASPLAIQGLTLEMLTEVSRQPRQILERRPPRWLSRATELLHERLAERLTITELASAVGIHPMHLAREFRRFHRCTIGEYLRRQRIESACRQLQASRESLAEIACSAGFADQSHFTRTFKRVVGMTPSQYRATFSSR